MKDQEDHVVLGYCVVHTGSGHESKTYATEAEAEQVRIEWIEEHLQDDIRYLTYRLGEIRKHRCDDIPSILAAIEAGSFLSPSDPDYEFLKELDSNPEAVEDIARRRSRWRIWVASFEL